MTHWFRAAVLLILVSIVGAQQLIASARTGRTTMVIAPPVAAAPQPIAASPATQTILLETGGAEFLSHMTPDDVARGLWALSQLPSEHALALTETQRLSVQPRLESGAKLRHTLETHRDEARRTQGAISSGQMRVIRAMGSQALHHARRGVEP